MKIKNYKQFIIEKINGYDYGCVMIDVPVQNWYEIISWIDSEDLYEVEGENYGVQERPHLTLLYGLHKEVTPDMVKSIFDNFDGNIEVEVDGIDIFENEKFDVVKFNIKPTESLIELNSKLSELPNSNEYPDYKPHITIAYVKSGMGKKYVKPDYKYVVKNINEVTYSMSNGEEFKIPLTLNENFKYITIDGSELNYDAEWKMPKNPIREMLEVDLRDILIEVVDLGYRAQLGGFIKGFEKSHVWICNKKGDKRIPLNWDEINDTVLRVEDYLRLKEFKTERFVLNEGRPSEQLYIYFDKEENIKENKMWYKTIPQILDWVKSKSDMPWLMIDTETTGLGGPKVQQLTQVSAIVMNYDFNSNSFKEIAQFDEKVKLTDETKSKYNNPGDKTKWVLGFNHYGSGNYKYKLESDVLIDFFNWVNDYTPCLLVAQNAQFDMSMLAVRSGNKINNEVFDTKMLIQLYFLPLIQKLSESDNKYKEMVDFIGKSERDGGLISSSMSKIGPALGINMSGYHDALTDCRLMMKMYQGIIDLLKKHQSVDISKYQMERIKVIRA
jgi:2'-5' RNA ligase/DNA polymerase III epsilon subunit-like protein